MIGLPYYIETHPAFVRYGRLLLEAVLADHERRAR